MIINFKTPSQHQCEAFLDSKGIFESISTRENRFTLDSFLPNEDLFLLSPPYNFFDLLMDKNSLAERMEHNSKIQIAGFDISNLFFCVGLKVNQMMFL